MAIAANPAKPVGKVSRERAAFFENEIRPLLVEHCFECHRGEDTKGGLRLDSLSAMLAGGDSGACIEIGDPDASLLMEAVRYESYEMPPSGKLSDQEISLLEKWIRIGAPWPGAELDGPVIKKGPKEFSEEDRAGWAFQPVIRPTVPSVEGSQWAINPIDRFIESRLRSEGLSPAPQADRESLIRRVSFDLTGLPPTPEEVDAFRGDDRDDAYERLVDRLLDSPEYGQRYARHWLDLVRYADSDGYRIDHYRPNAWRYRDYVIASLTQDKPYDRFIQEQIAGDELFPESPEALTATGYLTHWIYEYNNRDAVGQLDIILNEITDTTGDVFLGLGMQCAKCHDHKFDPILQKDYFKLRAFFEPLTFDNERVAATASQQQSHADAMSVWLKKTESLRSEIAALEEPYRQRKREAAITKFPADIQALMRMPREKREPREEQLVQLAWRQVDWEYVGLDNAFSAEDKERILELRRQLATFDFLKPPPLPVVQAVRDVGMISPATVIPKKNTDVQPGFLTLLDDQPAEILPVDGVSDSSGRRQTLARWLTRPDNPLTTRVITNRLWQWHFGRGLAENSSDFGKLSEGPTHPELLDWLTVRFVEGGWRMKPIHRLIVNSATYRQSASHPAADQFALIDPTNRLHWRSDTSRLDAEQIRDAILDVTGQLRVVDGGPGVTSDQPRRSIFTRVMRNSRDPLLDVFDLPLFFSSASSRDTTTSPIQSLLLINSQTMLRFAKGLAQRASDDAGDPESTVRRAWKLALGREIRREELEGAMQFLDAQTKVIGRRAATSRLVEIPTGKMSYRDGQSVDVRLTARESLRGESSVDVLESLTAPNDERLNLESFTVEAFFQLRSVATDGTVRTIVSKWDGGKNQLGWRLGVTGKGSRRKPQTLVFQSFGRTTKAGEVAEVVAFSDQHVELNHPYFLAVSIAGDVDGVDQVRFHLKDLSDDDSPMTTVDLEVTLPLSLRNHTPLTIGRVLDSRPSSFDGLIDEVRFSEGVLGTEKLLLAKESVDQETIAYWRLDPDPGLYVDSSANHFDLCRPSSRRDTEKPEWLALVDLCHLLLNSNEFLYVD